MSESDESARRQQDSWDRLQEHLSEKGCEDDFPVILTAYQASKCAAIVEAAREDDASWGSWVSIVTAFLHASADEAKAATVRPSAADRWAELESLPWPMKSWPNDGRSAGQVPTTPSFLRLVPITAENVRAVCELSVSADQERFVASTAVSLAESGVYPQAWCRAIEVSGVGLVGFVMLHDAIEEPGYMLWRLLVDQRFQGRGYGGAAVRSVAEYVRGRPGAVRLKVGARRGAGSPRAFYEALGFSPTGEVTDADEDVLIVDLQDI